MGRIWDRPRPSNGPTSQDLQLQRNFPPVRKLGVYVFLGVHLMLPFTDASASPSLTEAHGTCQHVLHRPAASSSSSTTTTNHESFQLAPRPNRWSYSVALRTRAPHTSTAPSTRRTASGSATIAPSTPTSGFVGKVRRRQTKANRRVPLEQEQPKGVPDIVLKAQADCRSRSPAGALRTSRFSILLQTNCNGA